MMESRNVLLIFILTAEGGAVIDPPVVRLMFDCYSTMLRLETYWQRFPHTFVSASMSINWNEMYTRI
jgi:hypothetical protein